MSMTTDRPAGWYPDPTNPRVNHYWTGTAWGEPPAADTTHAGTPASVLEPGWYQDPRSQQFAQHWNGTKWTGSRPYTNEPTLTAEQAADPEAKTGDTGDTGDRGLLIFGYTIGVLIPIIGWVLAISIGVQDRYKRIRAHAVGIALASITAAVIYTVIIVSASAAHSGPNVSADLTNLLQSKQVYPSHVTCIHQTGNDYECWATIFGQRQYATVTDDGHYIDEQGISAAGG